MQQIEQIWPESQTDNSRQQICEQILSPHIQIMEHLIESRINRSLMIHGLQNLVFEKRQRKTVQNTVNPCQQKQPRDSRKAEHKKTEAKQPVAKKGTKLQKLGAKGKEEKKKIVAVRKKEKGKAGKAKVQQSEVESQSQMIEESEDSAPVIMTITNPAKRQTRAARTNKKEDYSTKEKQIKPKQTLKQKRQEIHVISELDLVKNSQEQNVNQQILKDNVKQPTEMMVSAFSAVLPRDNHSVIQAIERTDPIVEAPIKLMKQTSQSHILIPVPSYAIKNKQEEMNNEEEESEQEEEKLVEAIPSSPAQQNSSPVNTRVRKAKAGNAKKYNDSFDDLDDFQSEQTEKVLKKKKRGNKIYKQRSRNNKPYSLNRIFRKEVKRNFPTFTVDVDLNKLSLTSFHRQFGSFDLIHFSCPISYLHLFPQMPILVEKGFVFVWVQQKQTQIGYHLLNRWGFDIIDQIIWVKANEDENLIEADNVDLANLITDDFEEKQNKEGLFINMKSTCLVGYKCPLGNKAEYRTKVSNNIIFAKALPGLKKPAQIYEIADLMMPGAKKLQFGGENQKGWLNLKHHERTLYRCNVCIRENNLFFLNNEINQIVKCKKCIINQIKYSSKTEEPEEIENIYREMEKIPILEAEAINIFEKNCSKCEKNHEQLSVDGFIEIDDQLFCTDCFKDHLQTCSESVSSLKIRYLRQNYYQQNQMTCSDCGVLTIHDIYFECTKCKSHIICKSCFWKIGSNSEEEKKIGKKDFTHQWKLKFIKKQPSMKFTCFGCKSDLFIPFWCCQTCQNWSWCGKCDKGDSEIHPHYQNGNHLQYLMM